MNDSNLIPNTERSPSELREMGRKGGIKSGESRRRKKRQRGYQERREPEKKEKAAGNYEAIGRKFQ